MTVERLPGVGWRCSACRSCIFGGNGDERGRCSTCVREGRFTFRTSDSVAERVAADALLRETMAERDALVAAVRWALGYDDEFPGREPGQGAYWWRTELHRRAGLDAQGNLPRATPAEGAR